MINILYTRFDLKALADFDEKLDLVPAPFRKKIRSYRRWEDRVSSLYGKLLLMKGLTCLNKGVSLEDICYSRYERPYLKQDLDFNISHSGKLVGVIISDSSRVGLDIEEYRDIEYAEFSSCFSADEWQDINDAHCRPKQFFDYWTRKECVIKADGKGLNLSLPGIDIRKDEVQLRGKKWYLHKMPVDDAHAIHIAVSTLLNRGDINLKSFYNLDII